MSELSKQEYQILYYFYGFNQSLTKNELLDK
ncbi:transcriptional regulator, BlaI/MecI/CopY family protein, partial [Listeria monocytogenes]|nr:transcriptional regulator, BlaI/MecI/CopY family protein [Listeria monocytogenes]